ncbi:acyltransferase family protein [Pseudomonas sp. CCI3.2]|nr:MULTISPECIES: acyltransferase family protein [unclassified Pseudomonas]MEB0076425.1 acyltransferase family protein [Pseudomonas sp. MH10out]MEB0091226.1 acyltransferase family protein [Pseudomonas sp. CCI4.2]MEB0100820.1 acyltransferase family protein [Pseudomonas sp. CCI3.2]MEB0128795.1 acyltransferase family protein [Pseudomonas sp. CCI2.4]MEB0156978.1 acyltransferase family protein [Pseudomonas sp. AH2 (2023)]
MRDDDDGAKTTKPTRICGYRPDIDGLRAIAVVLVALYHAKFPVWGGFVGVDVFYVISGYLITSIIHPEISAGTFKFRSFYERRIKRLLPAYLFLLFWLFLYCSHFLFADELISFAKSAIYSLIGLSNVYFLFGTGYFGSAGYEPLLHTWSISVEEQFYVFWPIILIVLFKLRRRVSPTWIIAGIFLLSLGLSEVFSHHHRNAAYLLLPFRFFELLIGSYLSIASDKIARYIRYPTLYSVVGLGLIIASAFMLNEGSGFPGIDALPVCLGAALIIACAMGPQPGIVNRWLSLAPVTYVGKISYSLYLWHWPVLILAEYRGIALTPLNSTLLLAGAFAASCVSYHWVEKPFRAIKSGQFQKVFLSLYLVPSAAIVVVALLMVRFDGFRSEADMAVAELQEQNTSHVMRSNCMEAAKIGNIEECHLGANKKSIDGVLIGDSFANAYAPFINALAADAGLMIHDTTMSSMPSIPGVFVMDIQSQLSPEAEAAILKYSTDRFEFAKKQRIAILSNFWNAYDHQNPRYSIHNTQLEDLTEKMDQYYFNAVGELLAAGVKVVIVAQPFAEVGRVKVNELRLMKLHHLDLQAIRFKPAETHSQRIEYKIKAKYPAVVLIDPNDELCAPECSPMVSGNIIFTTDGTHLNSIAAAALGGQYIKDLGNPLKNL